MKKTKRKIKIFFLAAVTDDQNKRKISAINKSFTNSIKRAKRKK